MEWVHFQSLPELLDFLPHEKQQIPRAAAFPKPGNLLWVFQQEIHVSQLTALLETY